MARAGQAPVPCGWEPTSSTAVGGQAGGRGAWRSGLHPRPHCPAPILGGMPPASTCHISRQTAVGDDQAPGALLVPLPPPSTLCCSPDRQTLAQSGGGRGRGPWPIWEPTLFSDPRKHVFLLLLSEQGGQQPQDREPRPTLGREVGTWAEPRAPVLCPTPPAPLPPVLSLQGLLARCSRVTLPTPRPPPEDARGCHCRPPGTGAPGANMVASPGVPYVFTEGPPSAISHTQEPCF